MEPELRGGNRTQSRAAASRPGSQPERIAVSTSSDQSAGAELQEVIAELSTPKMSQAGSGWVGLSDPRTLREIRAGTQASRLLTAVGISTHTQKWNMASMHGKSQPGISLTANEQGMHQMAATGTVDSVHKP